MAGIYIHVPFCSQRCVYCDFYFVTTAKTHAPYVRALRQEIERYGHTYGQREPINTVYFGGGTPSLLRLDDIKLILTEVRDAFIVAELEEVTFEINPEDATGPYLRGLRELGISRVSLGVQSFFDEDLGFMNRAHDSKASELSLDLIAETGFESYSADLIFGLPNQPPEYWGANLERIAGRRVPHISTYGLTIEDATPLAKQISLGHVAKPDDDSMADIYRFTMDYLTEQGYEQYEVSSFALPGHHAVHNARYWNHTNYIGFGPSAHSFWLDGSRATRWANIRNVDRYVGLLESRTDPVELREDLDFDTLGNEYIMLRLRTAEGLDLSVLSDRYGIDLYAERVDDLAWLEAEGYIQPIRNDRVTLAPKGKPLCDMVTSKLILA